MIALLSFFLTLLASSFKSKSRLEAENAALRHQLIVLRRKVCGRVQLTNGDRLFLVLLYRWFPSVLKTITIIRPETLVRWHRAGFRRYWRWKSRPLGGRPQIAADLRALIRRMSAENPLWGAPRIHGELLKLGFEVAQSSVAKYMVKRCGPSSQGWCTFLRNHAPDIAAMDLFVVPTIGYDLLYALVIVRLARRDLVWINVTPHPTTDWIARQITEAFPWNEAPRYLIRDRDRVYGAPVRHRLRAMGIRDKPPGSPWQNGFAERLIGSIRRECVDHVVVLGEAHLRRILTKYAAYYNELRTHRSLNKDAPIYRAIQHVGRIVSAPVLGGLHHHYCRI
jgi:transposase InsO family protein